MEAPIVDRRILRSKQMLRDALIDLIEEQGLEGLTVRDLTHRAGLNRGTFYLHYRDIQDLLTQSKQEVLDGLTAVTTKASRPKCPEDIIAEAAMVERAEGKQPLNSNPIVVATFEYFAEHARFFSVMMGSNGDPCFFLEWKKAMMQDMRNKSLAFQPDDNALSLPRDYLVAYIVSAQLGVIQHWLETGMQLSPKEMAEQMTRLSILGPKRIFHPSGPSIFAK